MSLIASFVLSFFPRDVLGEIWDLIESVSEGFLPTLANTCILNAAHQVSTPSVFFILEKKIVKVFTIYGLSGFRGEVVWNCERTDDGTCLGNKLRQIFRLMWAKKAASIIYIVKLDSGFYFHLGNLSSSMFCL